MKGEVKMGQTDSILIIDVVCKLRCAICRLILYILYCIFDYMYNLCRCTVALPLAKLGHEHAKTRIIS